MDAGALTYAQVEAVKASVRTRSDYFKRLAERMAARGFAEDEPVLLAAREAHAKVEELWAQLSFLGIAAFSREFDQMERDAKLAARLGKTVRRKSRRNAEG